MILIRVSPVCQIERAQKLGFPVTLMPEYQPEPLKAARGKVHTHLYILDPSLAPDVCSPIGGGWSVEQLILTIKRILLNEQIDCVSLAELGATKASSSMIKHIMSVMSE